MKNMDFSFIKFPIFQAKLQRKQLKFGFTFIELLVTFAIIATLFGLGLASFGDYGRGKKIEAESQKFVKVLENAKKRSRSSDRGGCSVLDHYRVQVVDPTHYTLSAQCSPSGTGSTRNYSINSDLDIEIPSDKYLKQNTLFYALKTQITPNCVIVSDIKTGKCYKIIITQGGVISNEKVETCNCP